MIFQTKNSVTENRCHHNFHIIEGTMSPCRSRGCKVTGGQTLRMITSVRNQTRGARRLAKMADPFEHPTLVTHTFIAFVTQGIMVPLQKGLSNIFDV